MKTLTIITSFMMLMSSGDTADEVPSEQFAPALSVEEYVRDYFSDIPVMAEVARCESTFRHFGTNGEIIRGKVNKSDIGVMQINTYYHQDTADRLEIDLFTLDGNLEYARNLYERKGTQPWSASKPCWGKKSLQLAQK